MTSKRIYQSETASNGIKQFHYVYRITNLVENKHYYGKRSSKIEPHLDIGTKYFSSSTDKQFIRDQKDNPQNYKYKVVRIFECPRSAVLFEAKLHSIFDVGRNPRFYNLSKQTANGFDTTGKVIVRDANGKKFIVPVDDPRYLSGELVSVSKGCTISESQRQKISATMKKRVADGVAFGETHRENLSKASKGKPKSRDAVEKTRRNIIENKLVSGYNHPRFKYWYVTPWGIFDSPEALEPYFTMTMMKNYCIRCDRVIDKFALTMAMKCQKIRETFNDVELLGKTYRELGFYTVGVSDFREFYEKLKRKPKVTLAGPELPWVVDV